MPDSLVALPYSDKLAVGGGAAQAADAARATIQRHMESLGCLLHEVEMATTWATNLGFSINGLTGKVGPSLPKAWKIKEAIGLLYRRPHFTGQQLETLFRTLHFSYFGQSSASVIFRACYTFVQRNNRTPVRVWKCVVREL